MLPSILKRLIALLAMFVCAVEVAAQMVSRIEIISGDRQIAINSRVPRNPFVVRVLDANGAPVKNLGLIIGPATDPGGPFLQDEFRFRGFNAPGLYGYTQFGFPDPEYVAVTDESGIASARGSYFDSPPSAFIVGARQWPGPGDVQAFFSVVATETPPPGNPSVVVEYFHRALGHYFNTLLQSEIVLLDAGAFPGWSRSTGSFIAYERQLDAPLGTVPVCRFFSSRYTAHFYTADQTECQVVIDRWPDVWTLETRAAFYIHDPDKTTGQCAFGLLPVYRLYSTRNGPNHRYITDRSLRDTMVAAGWVAEGFGPDAVMLCTPG